MSQTNTKPSSWCFAKVKPANGQAQSLFHQTRQSLILASDTYHSGFMVDSPKTCDVRGSRFPESNLPAQVVTADTYYELALESASQSKFFGWTLGFMTKQELPDRSIQCLLAITNTRDSHKNIFRLEFHSESRALMLVVPTRVNLEVLHDGAWRFLEDLKSDCQYGPKRSQHLETWVLCRQITHIRLSGIFEFAIELQGHPETTNSIVMKRNKELAHHLNLSGATTLLGSILPPQEHHRQGDYIYWKPYQQMENGRVSYGLDIRSGDKVRISRFTVTSQDQLSAVVKLDRFYINRQYEIGLLFPVAKFCQHKIKNCSSTNDEHFLIYPARGTSFAEYDFKNTDRDSRLTLFFQTLMGLAKLHGRQLAAGPDAITANNLLVLPSPDAPAAVVGCLPQPTIYHTPAPWHKARARDLLGWFFAVTDVIEREFGYHWNGAIRRGLEEHGEKHPGDAKLVQLLLRIVELAQGLGNRKTTTITLEPDVSSGNLIWDPCFEELGRWQHMREEAYSAPKRSPSKRKAAAAE